MNRILILPLAIWVAASSSCVSKNYVRQQVTPIINKVNELDDLTAQNTKAIKETDTRSQSSIQQLDTDVAAADQKALSSRQQAQQAQIQAERAAGGAERVQKTVSNIDDYRVISETNVQFQTDRSDLNTEARAELDQLAVSPNIKSGIVVIEGFTDSTGNADDNYSLSDRRADSVRQYLVARYNLPAYKVHTIGLGADNPIASNKTGEGRAKNRRAKVQIMSNSAEGTTTAGIR